MGSLRPADEGEYQCAAGPAGKLKKPSHKRWLLRNRPPNTHGKGAAVQHPSHTTRPIRRARMEPAGYSFDLLNWVVSEQSWPVTVAMRPEDAAGHRRSDAADRRRSKVPRSANVLHTGSTIGYCLIPSVALLSMTRIRATKIAAHKSLSGPDQEGSQGKRSTLANGKGGRYAATLSAPTITPALSARRYCTTKIIVGCPSTALSVMPAMPVPLPSQRHRITYPIN